MNDDTMKRTHKQVTGRGLIGVSVAVLWALAGIARAAPLSYPTTENIYLSSPQVTLTIQAGSAADGLVVDATSVVITLSSSTGGAFTLVSPQALSSSTIGTGGILAQTCLSGIETDVITQASGSETYTLTPTGSACVQPAPSGGSSSTTAAPPAASGVVVSVGGSYGQPYIPGVGVIAPSTPQPSSAAPSGIPPPSSTASLIAELADLESRLAALQAEANGTASSMAPFVFTRNLYFSVIGNDVKQLQLFLAAQNSGPAARKLKAHGTTEYFGSLTQNALIEFQKSANIKPAAGFFGPITRAYMNGL